MTTAGDERAHYAGSGAGVKFRKRPFRPEFNEEPQNVYQQEVGQNDSGGVSALSTHQDGSYAATIGMSELEQILKHRTFTRSEIQHLIALLNSRITDESLSDILVVKSDGAKPPPPPVLRPEPSTTSGSLKRHKHGDDRDKFHATGLPKILKALTSPQHPATIENLPDELLVKIFIRLLAKQLAQMRSVSKFWNALLSQSSFIKSHLNRSIHNNDRILLDFNSTSSTFTSTPFRIHTCRSSNPELTNFIKAKVGSQFEYCDVIRVIGSINGLICYSYNDSVIHILNPSLSASVTLPPNCMPSEGYTSLKVYFRFGFDPKTDDYKVVKLTGLIGPRTRAIKWWLQTEIYSMRKGTWDLITERFPSHLTNIAYDDYICSDGHDGHLHWLGYICKKRDSQRIVALNLSLQTFREIQLPDSTLDHDCSNVLGVLSRKLCVMSRDEDDVIEVWVMEEYGVSESWVKRHVFSRFNDVGMFGFTSQNEFLVVTDKSRIVLSDPVSKKETILEEFCFGRGGSDKIVEYVDSLVWVAPDKCEMVDGGGQN